MELKNKIEALLFASGRKMDLDELSKLIKVKDRSVIKDKLIELRKDYEARDSPIIVVDEGDFWKLTTKERFIDLVRQINSHTELSKTIMETLAVIAWKQPMLQSDVIKIRTNKAYDHVKELMDMGFVVKERYGRTYLLKLTQKFFEYFDVRNDESLKALFKDIKEEVIDQKQMSDFDVEEGIEEDGEPKEAQEDNISKEEEQEKTDDSNEIEQSNIGVESDNNAVQEAAELDNSKPETLDTEEDNNQEDIEDVQNIEDKNNEDIQDAQLETEQPITEEENDLTELEKEVNNENI